MNNSINLFQAKGRAVKDSGKLIHHQFRLIKVNGLITNVV